MPKQKITNLREHYIKTAKETFLKNYNSFLFHRIKYYLDDKIDDIPVIRKRLEKYLSPKVTSNYLDDVVEILRSSNTKLYILISTKDRYKLVSKALKSIKASKFKDWTILIIDNGTDNSYEKLHNIDKHILAIPLNQITGCAFLARNIGLDLLDYAFREHPQEVLNSRYLMIMDSDDEVHNIDSLSTLIDLTVDNPAMVHGYCNYVYKYEDNITKTGTYPEYFTDGLPTVSSLAEFFDKGPNILSAAIRLDTILGLRYPEEFSFEDNGLNHKMLYRYNKLGEKVNCCSFPIVKKNWGVSSEAGKNEKIGNVNKKANLSGIIVTGDRAKIVNYLSLMGSFFENVGI
jgi:glycosyltransferase involved in cell wall biosynthesis